MINHLVQEIILSMLIVLNQNNSRVKQYGLKVLPVIKKDSINYGRNPRKTVQSQCRQLICHAIDDRKSQTKQIEKK
jgi:hypothetical protein